MGLALFKEKRISERRKLTGLLPGKLVIAGTETTVSCRPVDVSRNGLGLLMAIDIPVGTSVVLHSLDGPIPMQVAWVQPDFGKQDMHRYGLMATHPDHNLEAIFVAAGCLR